MLNKTIHIKPASLFILASILSMGLPLSQAAEPVTEPSDNSVKFKISGRVHRMLQHVDDGINRDIYHTDSDQGPSSIKFDLDKQVNESLKLGATVEIGLQFNKPLLVSQDNRDHGLEASERIYEVYADSNKYGKLSVGKGFMSSWYVPETDLSGTQLASLLSPGMLFGGLKFADPQSNIYTSTRVRNFFFDSERFLLKERVRYDSIRLGGHTTLSGSMAEGDAWDITLRTTQQLGSFKIVAASSYQAKPFLDIDQRWDAAFSTLHEPSGLNFTLGGFISDTPDARDPDSVVVKLGWRTKFFDTGITAFSVDWSKSNDIQVKGDDTDSWSFFVIQHLDAMKLQIHAGIRQYEISDLPSKEFKPITIIPFGLAWSF